MRTVAPRGQLPSPFLPIEDRDVLLPASSDSAPAPSEPALVPVLKAAAPILAAQAPVQLGVLNFIAEVEARRSPEGRRSPHHIGYWQLEVLPPSPLIRID